MKDCVEVLSLPNKLNTRYSVLTINVEDLYGVFSWLISELELEQLNARKVLIFCRKRAHVRELYELFEHCLGPKGYVLPTGEEPMDDRTRLFAMYHKKTHNLVKEVVEREIVKPNGGVRVIFCTIAFGMGVDVKGANLVIHMGPSSDIDDYVQECGRVGRDEASQSHAVLLKYSGCTRSKHIVNQMKEYVKNVDVCRRKLLMKPFSEEFNKSVIGHNCCDICATSCACACTDCPENDCSCTAKCNVDNMSTIEKHIQSLQNLASDHSIEETSKHISQQSQINIRDSILQYRAGLAKNVPHQKLLTGLDLATGYSKHLIDNIMSNINNIDSLETLEQRFSFFSIDHAKATWEIITTFMEDSDSEQAGKRSSDDDSDSNDESHIRISLGSIDTSSDSE